jgi:hypothetical protein
MVMAMKPVTGKLRKGGGKGLSGDALVGKVSQSTINSIKKMGMTEALKLAGKNGKTSGGMAREFQEGVRRMYGAKRLEAAKTKYAPAKSTSADAARSKAMGAKPASKAAVKAVSTKSMSKGSSMSTKAKVVGGTVAAVALAAKGGPAGRKVASKLAPGLAKSAVGRALFGTAPKMSPSMLAKYKAAAGPKAAAAKVTVGPKGSFGPTTKTMAKSKLGTASEYASKAGQASARASIKPSGADAARAAASKVTKKKAAGASLASNKRK